MIRSSQSRSVSNSNPGLSMTMPELPSTALNRIDQKLLEVDQVLVKVSDVEATSRHLLTNLTSKSEKLDVGDLVELDRALQAVTWVSTIQAVGQELDEIWLSTITVNPAKKKNLDNDYTKVVGYHKTLVTLVSALLSSTCSNLRLYAIKMLECNRERWIGRLEKQLEEDMEILKFPRCILDQEQGEFGEIISDASSSEFMNGKSSADDMIRVTHLQKHFRMLWDLSLPENVAEKLQGLKPSDPLGILVNPLKKRFKFHFSGNKKTNNPEKPEWCLQQVGAWMRNSQKFFDICIHPTRRPDESSKDFPGHAQFCCRLLDLVIKKLKKDIDDVIYDDVILSHLINETILFSRDVLSREFALFIPLDRLPLVVLSEPIVFTRWISIERKFAFEKVDDLLLEEGSWSPSVARSDVSKGILTFEALLQSITNRYKSLSSVQLQLNFVDLQIELLEDLRLRLAQILRQEHAFPLNQKFCLILSSSQYLIDMLNHWAEIPLFLQLQLERSKETGETDPRRGLFRDIVDGFDFLVSDLIKTLSDHVFYEVKSRSRPYRCEVKWFSYKVFEEPPWDTTPESFPIFQLLAAHLTLISNIMAGSALLSRIVSEICDRLSNFFITEVILENNFSSDGCKQIQIDVEGGIAALFEPFLVAGKRPENYEELREVCKLLNLKQANAMLLLEGLRGKKDVKDIRPILDGFGVSFLSHDQVVKILNRRIDLL